ncbi:hypothetical protein OB13_02535 [Pontibacter sp. HJ8]
MKKSILFSLIIILLSSCAKKQIANSSGQANQSQSQLEKNNENLIGRISQETAKVGIDDNALLVFDGKVIDKAELKLLNELKVTDFVEIKALSKDIAVRMYNEQGEKGAVIIIPFKDELLDTGYYEGLTNEIVVKAISEYESQGLINKNPILIINGVPLLGDEIINRINALGENDISKINLLKKQTAYSIYGIRAMNGVLLIDTQ